MPPGPDVAVNVLESIAKERGEIRKDIDVRATGELLTSTMFALAVLGRSGFERATLDGIVSNTLASHRD